MNFDTLSPYMKPVDVSWHPEFDDHELVLEIKDPSGLRAFIAFHRFFFHTYLDRPSTLGGTRFCDYLTEYDAITDVLRLSRAMSKKAAWAGTSFGGAKAVIMGKPEDRDPPISREMQEVLSAYAKYLNLLDGRFVTAEDMNFHEKYLTFMRRITRWVAGEEKEAGGTGDPAHHTAHGVYLGIKSGLSELYGERKTLENFSIAIPGVGGVGLALAKRLQADGAILYIADTDDRQVGRARQALGSVLVMSPKKIHTLYVAVYSPCAMGAVLNEDTIHELSCSVVAGGANNQLATPEDGERLHKRGILYAPDYVINAGGLMSVAREFDYLPKDRSSAPENLALIPQNLSRIWSMSKEKDIPPNVVADEIAEGIIAEKLRERNSKVL